MTQSRNEDAWIGGNVLLTRHINLPWSKKVMWAGIIRNSTHLPNTTDSHECLVLVGTRKRRDWTKLASWSLLNASEGCMPDDNRHWLKSKPETFSLRGFEFGNQACFEFGESFTLSVVRNYFLLVGIVCSTGFRPIQHGRYAFDYSEVFTAKVV